MAKAVGDLLNAEAGSSFIGDNMGGEPLAAIVTEGVLPAGAASSVAIGAAAVLYVSFVSWMSWKCASLVVALNSSPQLKLPHSIVIYESDLPNEQDCEGERQKCKADTCKGDLHICSVRPDYKLPRIAL